MNVHRPCRISPILLSHIDLIVKALTILRIVANASSSDGSPSLLDLLFLEHGFAFLELVFTVKLIVHLTFYGSIKAL